MDINMDFRLHNKFEVSCYSMQTGDTKEQTCYNVITNYGLAQYKRLNLQLSSIQFGSGSGVPSANDTALFKQELNKESSSIEYDFTNADEGIAARVDKVVLNVNELKNTTISELGYSFGVGAKEIFNHAMIEPPIQKGELDIITITATIYLVSSSGFVYGNRSIFLTSWGVRALLGEPYNSYNGYIFGASSISFCNSIGKIDDYRDGLSPTVVYSEESNKVTYTCRANPEYLASSILQNPITGIASLKSHYSSNSSTCCGFYIQAAGSEMLKVCNFLEKEKIGIADGLNKEFSVKFNYPHDFTVYKNGIKADKSTYAAKEYTCKRLYAPCLVIKDCNIGALDLLTPCGDRICTTEDNYFVVENLSCEYGIKEIKNMPNGTVSASDDMEIWSLIGGEGLIPEQYRKCRFFKYTGRPVGQSYGQKPLFCPDDSIMTSANVIFNEAPASGDVITVDYYVESIPKSPTNALDITIQFTVDTDTSPIG